MPFFQRVAKTNSIKSLVVITNVFYCLNVCDNRVIIVLNAIKATILYASKTVDWALSNSPNSKLTTKTQTMAYESR